MEGKRSFVLYTDLIHIVKKLPKDKQADLFLMILEYVNDLNPKTNDLLVEIAFEPIKRQLKRDLVKYEERANRARQNGSKGGRPPNNNPEKPSGFPSNPDEPRKPDTVNVTVNDNVNDNKEVFPDSKKFVFPDQIEDSLVKKTTKDIANFFSISEMNQAKHFIQIGNFVRCMEGKGKLDYLIEQFNAYRKIKKDTPMKYIHKWHNYIGSPEESYEDGSWNKENWLELFKKSREDQKVLPTRKQKIRNV